MWVFGVWEELCVAAKFIVPKAPLWGSGHLRCQCDRRGLTARSRRRQDALEPTLSHITQYCAVIDQATSSRPFYLSRTSFPVLALRTVRPQSEDVVIVEKALMKARRARGASLEITSRPKTDGTSYGSDSSVDSFRPLTPSSPERHPRKAYGRRAMELVEPVRPSYHRSLAVYGNKVVYLARCRSIRIVPAVCLAEFFQIRDPRHVVRILDMCSHKLMLTDLDYNRMRKV
ncbi:hypothetical protein HPB50_002598 [Hyalomma asiaticum]|uniref:Uncharacterized protein n=1 Tax=Hyalomma asiaticum TaxID=266040 RepID=A0ACB7SDP1_HYAAI|nr:hypothetical protein HPB50_002598 [Hyalomma asiaticum]